MTARSHMMLTGEAGSSMRYTPARTMASMPFGHSEEMSTRMRSTRSGRMPVAHKANVSAARRASGCAPSGEKRRARARPRYLRSSSPQSSPCRSLKSLKWSTSKQTMLTSRAPECLRYAAASSKKASLPSSPVAASMRGASMETRAKPVEPASPSRPAVDLSVTRVPF